jgi:NOL1/NOP2/fmu family ribosome biogenesis protein
MDFIPSAALALSIDLQSASYPHIDCTLNEALDFLRAGTPRFTSPLKGWHLITYKEVTLGWAKNLGTRWNNYFPKSWRIVQQGN